MVIAHRHRIRISIYHSQCNILKEFVLQTLLRLPNNLPEIDSTGTVLLPLTGNADVIFDSTSEYQFFKPALLACTACEISDDRFYTRKVSQSRPIL